MSRSGSVDTASSCADCSVGLCEQVAIDFTGSNGAPSSPQSLHYRDPRGFANQYQLAISSVGGVLEFYDSDKLFPVFGFGGSPAPGMPVSHCFPLGDGSGGPCVGECSAVSSVTPSSSSLLSSFSSSNTLSTHLFRSLSRARSPLACHTPHTLSTPSLRVSPLPCIGVVSRCSCDCDR